MEYDGIEIDICEMMEWSTSMTEWWMAKEHPSALRGYPISNGVIPFLFTRPMPGSDGLLQIGSLINVPEIHFRCNDLVVAFRGMPVQYAAQGRENEGELEPISDPLHIRIVHLSAKAVEEWMQNDYPCCGWYGNFQVFGHDHSSDHDDGIGILHPSTKSVGTDTGFVWEAVAYKIKMVGVFSTQSSPDLGSVTEMVARNWTLPDLSITTACLCGLSGDHDHDEDDEPEYTPATN